MKVVKQVISVAVLAIGLYTLYNTWGPVSDAMLTALAITLLGGLHTYKSFMCCSSMKK